MSFCGIQEHEVLSGGCARISQSPVGRRSQSGCRSVGMMGDSEANSLNRTCVGTSLGSQPSPETQTYEAGKGFFLLLLFKCLRGYEGKCVVYTWQSRFQWDGPDSIPSYTLGDSSLHSKDGSLRKTHTHKKQIQITTETRLDKASDVEGI